MRHWLFGIAAGDEIPPLVEDLAEMPPAAE